VVHQNREEEKNSSEFFEESWRILLILQV